MSEYAGVWLGWLAYYFAAAVLTAFVMGWESGHVKTVDAVWALAWPLIWPLAILTFSAKVGRAVQEWAERFL